MKPRLVHLGINPVGAVAHLPTPASWPVNFFGRLQGLFDTHALNWYRYGSQNYVLFTSISKEEVTQLIAGMPGFQNVYVLMSEIPDLNAFYGSMPQQFWSWINNLRK
jgi:hypothetical protein